MASDTFLVVEIRKDAVVIDYSLNRQTFEIGKLISTAEKSILNLVKLQSLVRKIW